MHEGVKYDLSIYLSICLSMYLSTYLSFDRTPHPALRGRLIRLALYGSSDNLIASAVMASSSAQCLATFHADVRTDTLASVCCCRCGSIRGQSEHSCVSSLNTSSPTTYQYHINSLSKFVLQLHLFIL